MCESGCMAQTSSIILTAADRERLAAIVADRNRPHKHVQRACIILYSDERLPVLEVARRAGASRPAVWRWQQRFADEGVEGPAAGQDAATRQGARAAGDGRSGARHHLLRT